jgi:FAD binding domain
MADADQRAVLAALADVLVPGDNGMPSASEANAHGKWLDRALVARPDLEPVLVRILAGARGRDPEQEVRRLDAEEPEAFAALMTLVAGAYTMNLKVRKRLGYPGQKHNPPFPDEAEYYLDGGLLEPVLDRGPFGPQPPPATPPRVRRGTGAARTDVLVVGAGAAGSVAARHLAEAGFRVVCLEQGGWRSADEFPGDKARVRAPRSEAVERRPERARPAGGLPDGVVRVGRRPGHVQRRRRKHDPLRRPVSAHAPLRLPGADARGPRRRLAHLL